MHILDFQIFLCGLFNLKFFIFILVFFWKIFLPYLGDQFVIPMEKHYADFFIGKMAQFSYI